MQLPFDQTQLTSIASCDAEFDRLSASWRSAVDWHEKDVRETRRIYEMYPLLFAPAFPEIPAADLRTLVLACRLLAESLFAFDEVIDEPLGPYQRATGVGRGQSLQLDAIRTFAELFPAGSEFWPALHDDFHAYIVAIRSEREIELANLDEQTACALARGKTAVARSCLTAMGLIAGRTDRATVLAAAVSEYYVARQMWDDVTDWRTDLAGEQRSLVLARAIADLPADSARDTQTVGAMLYYGGHAEYVLALGSAALDRARAQMATVEIALPIGLLFEQLAQRFRDTRTALSELVERKRRTLGARPLALPAQPAASSAEEAVRLGVLWTAAQYLAVQAPRSFGEARHWMKLADGLGLRAPLIQAGDVFQRALIGDALADLPAELAPSFAPVIEHEVRHVLALRACDSCGWGYFPGFSDLPADADTLAQVLQLTLRADSTRRDDFERPIATALSANRPDGSFETWIMPPPDERDELHQRQAMLVDKIWGWGADTEVMANLLYALAIWDRDLFADRIAAGARFIIDQQRADSTWHARWYVGPYYSTYVHVRFLALVGAGTPAVSRAITALLANQEPDGTWSRGHQLRALDTAHAILALHAVRELGVADPAAVRAAVQRGLAALWRLRRRDGAWPADAFLAMREMVWGSNTITTAYIAKAAALAREF